MLAQITPEILKALPQLGEGFLFAGLILYGTYLLLDRFLKQQESDRTRLLDMLLSQVDANKREIDSLCTNMERIARARSRVSRKVDIVLEEITKIRETWK